MKRFEEMKGACIADLIVRGEAVLKLYSVADTQHC